MRSFLILFLHYRKKQWNLVGVNALLLLVVGGLSAYAGKVNFVQPKEDKGLTVTLAQGNIEQNLKWDPEYLYATVDIYQKQIFGAFRQV